MRSIQITDGAGRSIRALEPETRRERMRGIKGMTAPAPMLFRRTRSVHTFGMASPIDVVLLDERCVVVGVVRMRPRRVLVPRRRVSGVLEMREAVFEVGETLAVEPSDEPGANGGEGGHADQREGDGRDRDEPARPGGKRHGLTPAGRRRHETEPLEEHPHVLPSADARRD